MWIKDIFNEISGYEQPTTFPKDEPPTPFETFFQRGD
jgi:hypothetical protein